MLHRYVSLDKYGDLFKIIIKKIAQTDVGNVPRKSFAATMFQEMETLLKIHVQEELLKGQEIFLHTAGTSSNL